MPMKRHFSSLNGHPPKEAIELCFEAMSHPREIMNPRGGGAKPPPSPQLNSFKYFFKQMSSLENSSSIKSKSPWLKQVAKGIVRAQETLPSALITWRDVADRHAPEGDRLPKNGCLACDCWAKEGGLKQEHEFLTKRFSSMIKNKLSKEIHLSQISQTRGFSQNPLGLRLRVLCLESTRQVSESWGMNIFHQKTSTISARALRVNEMAAAEAQSEIDARAMRQ